MIKQNTIKDFTEFDTFSRRKFLESLGIKFYGEPVFQYPVEQPKQEKTGDKEQSKKE